MWLRGTHHTRGVSGTLLIDGNMALLFFYTIASILQKATGSDQPSLQEANFVSDWLPVRAQSSTMSGLDVVHGLGVVPDIVEVLVKAVNGPNVGFTFKAMGNAERDDDMATDRYAGVTYVYNHEMVRIFAASRCNGQSGGGAIYTGESPYWTGVNSQFSLKAEVQVRCWLPDSLPPSCFNQSGTPINSGKWGTTFVEVEHGLGSYPQYVKVRARLLGNMDGWYSDAEGSATGFHGLVWSSSSGVKFAYNESIIRVWTWSEEGVHQFLYEAIDGWGNDCQWQENSRTGELETRAWCDFGNKLIYDNIVNILPGMPGFRWQENSRTGELETRAWCDFGNKLIYDNIVNIVPGMPDSQLQVLMPDDMSIHDPDVLVSVMTRVETGTNAGFMFQSVGSAKGNSYPQVVSPCRYGGIVYAYSDTALRLWRPDSALGSPVCINDNFGGGAYSQGADNVTVIIRVWKALWLRRIRGYQAPLERCLNYYLAGGNSTYTDAVIEEETDVTSQNACIRLCNGNPDCVTFSFTSTTCKLFSTFVESLLMHNSTNSEVWTLRN